MFFVDCGNGECNASVGESLLDAVFGSICHKLENTSVPWNRHTETAFCHKKYSHSGTQLHMQLLTSLLEL